MRAYPKSNPASIRDIMEKRGQVEGRDYLVVQGEIKHPLTEEGAGMQPFCVELGIAEPGVGQEAIDAFFARPNVQIQLGILLELQWKLEMMMTKALGQDQVATPARLAWEQLRMDGKREGG